MVLDPSPPPPPPPGPPLLTHSAPPREPPLHTPVDHSFSLSKKRKIAAAAAVVIAFVWSLRRPGTLATGVNYLSGFALLAGTAWIFTRAAAAHTGRQWIRATAWAALVITGALHVVYDYRYEEWSETQEDGVVWHFKDWSWRGWGAPHYRRIDFVSDLGEQYIIVRFSKYGKLMGLRTHNIKNPPSPEALRVLGYEEDENGFYKQTYYWYDEEITEGEWHLRNR